MSTKLDKELFLVIIDLFNHHGQRLLIISVICIVKEQDAAHFHLQSLIR